MAKIKPITISFKNNEEDQKLYNWISSKSNFSGFIKDILREKMEEDGNFNPGAGIEESTNNNDKLLDLTDFEVE